MRTASTIPEILIVLVIAGLAAVVFLPGKEEAAALLLDHTPDVVVGLFSLVFIAAACLTCPTFRHHPLLILPVAAAVYGFSFFAGWMVLFHFQWAAGFVLLAVAGAIVYFVVASNRRVEQ